MEVNYENENCGNFNHCRKQPVVEVLNKLLSDYGEYIMYEMYDFSTSLTDEDAELLTKTENFLFDSKMIDNHVNVKDLFYLSE